MVSKLITAKNSLAEFLQTKRGKQTKILVVALSVILIFAIQLFFNHFTLLFADDYSYSFSWETSEKLSSFSELIPSIKAHNLLLNGRSVNHFIAQFFLLLNNLGYGMLFDLCNSLVYVALIFLATYHSIGSFKKIKLWHIVGIHLCLWFFVPDYAGCFYWLIGSCNYSWSMLTVLLYFVPFTGYTSQNAPKKSAFFIQLLLAAIYLPLGILAGNSNENTAVAVVIMTVLFMAKCLLEKKKLRLWMFSGLIGVLLGFGAMLFSPGQKLRTESAGGLGGIGTWIKNAIFITLDVFDYLAVPLLMLSVVLIFVFATNKKLKLIDLSSFLIFFIGSGCSIYCMTVSPQFPDRSWTPPVIFAVIAFFRLATMIRTENGLYRRAICVLLALGTVCFGSTCLTAYLDIKQTNAAHVARSAYLTECAEKGETAAVAETVKGWSKYNVFNSEGDLNKSSSEWPNTAIARYYGLKRIIKSDSYEGYEYETNK